MNFLTGLTSRSLAVLGGLLATSAAVLAEATTDTTVGTGSFLLGGAGLIAAISAFVKDYWSDRQKQRDHEVAMLRIKMRSSRAGAAVRELYNWARAAHLAVAALPAVPEVHFDEEDPDADNHLA